jgi:zinc transporter
MPCLSTVNPTTSNYGADAPGLICGFLIGATGAGDARVIDSEQAALWPGARRSEVDHAPNAGFAWLHFNLAHTGALPWLAERAALASEFYDTLQGGLRSTRSERIEQSLIAVISDVHLGFEIEPSDISTLWINVVEHLVVTARQHPLCSVAKLRDAKSTAIC